MKNIRVSLMQTHLHNHEIILSTLLDESYAIQKQFYAGVLGYHPKILRVHVKVESRG